MMLKSRLFKTILNRNVLFRIGLVVFGLTLFPGFVFLVRDLFFSSSTAIPDSYAAFYSSLLDFSVKGMISWSIAYVPYLAYDVFLMIKNNRTKKSETVEK
jgi:hypothetical protein